VKFNAVGLDYELAVCHLSSGDSEAERLNELTILFDGYTVGENSYICGDLNEHLNESSKVIKLLTSKGFTVSDSMFKRLEDFTCDKMRSAMQFQINKMRVKDQSTKDIILGQKEIDLGNYQIVWQKISDHKMVIAQI